MSKEQKIKAAASYYGVSQAKLAAAIGMTPSNFNQKLKRDTFTDEELAEIANALGAEFVPCAFLFPDGTKI
ncbi:MAG: helix-turn-helix transcriptional regulator [Eubacteriales bacterium]|nr:helix-turn-helix transcriptional regulator [Eubacteriales bacterium]